MRRGKSGKTAIVEMLKFQFDTTKDHPLNILCLGAHSDDIEIGCGGTILKILHNQRDVAIVWVVLSSGKKRKLEAEKSADAILRGAKEKRIIVKDFKDGFLPYCGGEIKTFFEELKAVAYPDLIFTHYRSDLHQDHRLISELTWNTFRNHLILEYEIPKYDGDIGCPNLFVHLSRRLRNRKTAIILECFQSQVGNHWFDRQTFHSIMRIRGIESNAPDGYAEAFYCRKIVF